MGLLGRIRQWGRRLGRACSFPATRHPLTGRTLRVCRFEQMESRQLLSVVPPIHIGAVYHENEGGEDLVPDQIEITFTGGAPGTQLAALTIETDKLGDGLTIGDVFFDTAPGGKGAFASAPLVIVSQNGIDSVQASVADDSTTLTFTFTGFDPGEKLVFTIDVDEMGFLGANAVAEGNEFEGSRLYATFTAPHYYDATGDDMFLDFFDVKLAGSGLDLPPDSYVPPGQTPDPINTAGAIFSLQQRPLPITIAGKVFEDLNRNNEPEPSEPGLPGVLLTLLHWDAGQWASTGLTTTTDAQGEYRFDGLLPGTYRVVETQPEGYLSVGARAGTVDGLPRGSVLNADTITGIALLGGENSIHNDFAETRPASLSGHVYHDANNNGVMDLGESGIGGATLYVQYLPDQGPLPAPIALLTLADGSWSVAGLMPGSYRVDEVQPAGYLDGLDAPGTAGGAAQNPGDRIDGIQLAGGQAGANYDFGELLPSSISGRVSAELNGDCVYQPGEPLLADVTIRLRDASGAVIATTLTDANGEYTFAGLPPGVYAVEELQPAGYFDGCDSAGSAGGTPQAPDSIVGIVLVSGTTAVRYDFHEIIPNSIRGRVSVDRNANGAYEPGEPLLAGVTMRLRNAQGQVIATTLTNALGEYAFTNLDRGVYAVEEVQPAGYFDGTDLVGTAGGSLAPPDAITGITLVSGTAAARYDFLELEPVSLAGFVYEDDNNNGLRDAGEAGIGGVTLTLLDAAGNPTAITAVTDASGYYRFDGLAPDAVWGVAEAQPDGYYDGLDTPGNLSGSAQNPGDAITGVLIPAAAAAEDYNFGELRPASIRGKVYVDANGNGVADAGETLLAGVTIHLLDPAGNRLASTLTGSEGRYAFTNLRPGTYGLEQIQPDGYFDSLDYPGSAGGSLEGDDRIVGAKLIAGLDAVNYDFTEVAPASLSGYVFQDGAAILRVPGQPPPDPYALRDGRFTPDDTPLAGVLLILADARGAPLLDAHGNQITTRTDASGHYAFSGLRPGMYTVIEVQPSGYLPGVNTPGSTGGLALHPTLPPSPTIPLDLAISPMSDAIIRIPLAAGEASTANNFSEILMQDLSVPQPPPPLPPLPPLLAPPPLVPGEPQPGALLAGPERRHDVLTPLHGGGSIDPIAYTWHLSVINAGQPRNEQAGTRPMPHLFTSYFNPVSWSGADLNRALWILADREGKPVREFSFGLDGGTPVTGDWNGDGVAKLGVFLGGIWFLDLNGNGVWDNGDLWAQLGQSGDQPVSGDWDGDGKTDIGILGPAWAGDGRALAAEPGLPDVANRRGPSLVRHKNLPPDPEQAPLNQRALKRSAQGKIRADLIDHVFRFGRENDVSVTGDWNGDGIANIGLFRHGVWCLDADGDGAWSANDIYVENFGQPGDLPVTGDWTGDGVTKLGVYRGGTWYLDTNNNRALDTDDKVLHLGGPHDIPVVGDWDGDGVDEIGLYRPAGPKVNEQVLDTAAKESAPDTTRK